MMKGLSDYYGILESAGPFLTPAESWRLNEAVYLCCANYTWLADWAMRSGHVRYNVVLKHHMFCHVPEVTEMTLNPRLVSTYMEESFISQGLPATSNVFLASHRFGYPRRYW